MTIILKTLTFLGLLLLSVAASALAHATDQIPGFASAVRQSEVASTESGVVVEVLVKEGDFVQAGQPIVRLDYDVHEATLKATQLDASNTADIRVQQVRVRLLEQAVAKLNELVASGAARPLELERESTELEMARATLEWKKHEYQNRQHNVERARLQLEKRTICSPISGYVTKLNHKPGEFVSINNPQVATIIDDSELEADFSIPLHTSRQFRTGQTVQLQSLDQTFAGTVDHVQRQVDRSSQTVIVRVRFQNSDLQIKPGTDLLLWTTAPDYSNKALQRH